MLIKFFSVLILILSVKAFAFDLSADFKGFVDIGSKELYVDYQAPEEGRPTVVLLNGLTYTTVQWDKMVKAMKTRGLGVVRYDMDGMGKTLIKYGYPNQPFPFMDQVTDLNALLKAIKLPAPYNIAGLSYGGGIGGVFGSKYPKKINNLILMAPYTHALEKQDVWIKDQIAMTRFQFPFNPYSDDALYDYFLKEICYTTYPIVEPIVLEHPYKLEAVFRMTQGIRKLNLNDDVARLPKNSVFLVTAEKDQYIPKEVLEDFWAAIPANAKVERIIVKNSEHKIPESQPDRAAEIVDDIVSREK